MKRILLFTLFNFFSFCLLAQEYDSLVDLSKSLRNQGEFEQAIINYNYLLSTIDKQSIKAAYLYNVIGISYAELGDKQNTLKYYYAAVKLNKKLKNSDYLRKNYVNIANYYGEEGQIDKSNHYLYLAKDLIKDPLSSSYGVVMAILGQNHSSLYEEDPLSADSASFYYLEAIQIFKQNKSGSRMANLYNDLAILYHKQGQINNAEEYYLKSIALADSLNMQYLLVTVYRNLGNNYMEQNNFEQALIAYNKSLSLSSVEKDPTYQVHIYSNLVKAKMALGQVEEASVLFQRFNKIRDSLHEAENIQQVKEMETKYETELKEQAIKDQQITIANKTFEKNIFLSLTILLVLLIVVAIWFFNQKQKYLRKLKNEEIANVKKGQELMELNAMMQGQEEERNRIANDLHDRLGARLSSIKLLFQNKSSKNGEEDQLLDYIDKAIKETREISHNLSTDMLTRFGIQTAIKDTIKSIQQTDQIEADLVIYGMTERWPVEVERNIYYVLLELINNTIKHANASSLIIQIHQSDRQVNVFYEDNGQGFDTETVNADGLGMRSLSARVNAIKGQMVVNSKPGHGINVVITLDLNASDKTIMNIVSDKR